MSAIIHHLFSLSSLISLISLLSLISLISPSSLSYFSHISLISLSHSSFSHNISLSSPGDRHYMLENGTIGFEEGSFNGRTVCVAYTVVNNVAFNKLLIFSVHVTLLEVGVFGITFHRAWAWVHIYNNDCEFGGCEGGDWE